MNCVEGIEIIEKIAKKKKDKTKFTYIALLGMSSERQKIIAGKKKILEEKQMLAIYPQTLIITGKLNEKENECLEKLHK